jgi:ABC-type Fe3+/spermidine/putrescine transport system ATPase subunit
VVVSVRPEKVMLVGDIEQGEVSHSWNKLSGAVQEVIYLGTHTQYVIQLPSDGTIVVHRQNLAQRSDEVRPGDPAEIAFDPESATVLAG